MPQQRIAVEQKAPAKGPPAQQVRKPEAVVGPHLVERHSVDGDPQRRSLVCLLQLAFAAGGAEDGHEQRVTVHKLKGEFAARRHARRGDAQLLLHFADGAVQRRFAVVEPPARPVDFARAEAALLADQQDLIGVPHEQERCALLGRPVLPIDVCKANVLVQSNVTIS